MSVNIPETPMVTVAMKIVSVALLSLLLAALTFYVIDLATDLFNPVVGFVLNVVIIGVFLFFCWKLRFVLYENLKFLH